MKEVKNVPALRFPGFEGEWDEARLEDVYPEIVVGFVGTISDSYCDAEDGIPLIRTLNVRDGYFTLDNIEYVTPKFHDANKKSKIYNGDILIARVGANMGKVCRVEKLTTEANSANVIIIKNFEGNDSRFFALYLSSQNGQQQILSRGAGGAQAVLNISVAKTVFVPRPTLLEQQKIASFLTAVDEKLQALKKKKRLLEEYKKGIMQKFFSQELRFKDDEGKDFSDWEKKTLGQIGQTFNGLAGKTKESFGTGKPYIQYKQVFDDSKIDLSRCGLVEILPLEKQNRVQFGDVLFTTSSETPDEVGLSSVYLESADEIYLNSFCFGYRTSANQLYPCFSVFLFRSPNFREQVMLLAQGSTRYNISKTELMKAQILLPSYEEQCKIANILSAIDEKIAHCSSQIMQIENWKKGISRKMFV